VSNRLGLFSAPAYCQLNCFFLPCTSCQRSSKLQRAEGPLSLRAIHLLFAEIRNTSQSHEQLCAPVTNRNVEGSWDKRKIGPQTMWLVLRSPDHLVRAGGTGL